MKNGKWKMTTGLSVAELLTAIVAGFAFNSILMAVFIFLVFVCLNLAIGAIIDEMRALKETE